MSKRAAAQESEHDEHEAAVVESMSAAHAIAEAVFGLHMDTTAVLEIYDYLQEADEEEFATDLKRVVEHAKIAFKTTSPTPDQVFGLFERIFITEED